MATLDQLSAALVKADAAGNVDDARAFAAEIRRMRSTEAKQEEKPSFLSMLEDEAIGSVPVQAAMGAVRGAGSIGATLLAPYDIAKDALSGRGLSLESNRERRQAMTGGLQELGAKPESFAFQAGKLGGEIAGTAGVPGALAKGAQALRLATPLVEAIRTAGMSAGGLKGAPGMLARITGGAISGGTMAGMVDPESAGTGALIGGALPPVVQGAKAVGRGIGTAFSGKLAQQKALDQVAGALGDDTGQAIADIQTYYPKGAENIPVSAAAATRNPALATLEQGSRVKGSPSWYEFDQKQAKALFENVMKATDEAEQLGERLGKRSENWRAAWQKASEAQKPRVWANRMTQFADNLDLAAVSPDASNPAVRGVVDAIRGEIDRVGPNLNPGHLQQIRANLSGRANSMSPDAFKAAPRDSAAVKSIIKEIDDILNATTGGKWQKVIEGYAQGSKGVQASKAAAKVRGSFLDETGRIRGVSADTGGDVAKVTEAGLGRAMDAARLPDKSLALSEPARARLEATLDAIRRQNIVQGVKRTATAGGGSDTISNAFAAQAARSGGAPNMLIQLIEGVQQIGTRKSDEALARLLSNPDELAKALSIMGQQKTPNALAALAYRSAPVIAARP